MRNFDSGTVKSNDEKGSLHVIENVKLYASFSPEILSIPAPKIRDFLCKKSLCT